MKIKKTLGEQIFDVFNVIILLLLTLVVVYPCYYILVASVSNPAAIYQDGGLLLWPKEFGMYSYQTVFENSDLWRSYGNTIFYVVAGTFLSVMLTTSAAFCASRKTLPGKNIIMFLIMFTMYFNGGLIPTYMVVKNLGITDSYFAMIIPTAVSTYNLIITLSYFRGIPESMEEAAKIDGATDFKIFYKVMLPLAKPIIAVIALYYAVAIWNNYYTALIYLSEEKYYPLQSVLRQILLTSSGTEQDAAAISSEADGAAYAANIRYATIVVSTVPILCVYPFIQKYFIKGVMIGAVKG